MSEQPNPLQKLVRGTIREFINEVNNSKTKRSKCQKLKTKKRQQNTKKEPDIYLVLCELMF